MITITELADGLMVAVDESGERYIAALVPQTKFHRNFFYKRAESALQK